MTAGPTAERSPLLDILRGFALFGILLVNVEYFGQTIHDGWFRPEYRAPVDVAVQWLVIALLQLKAYLLFALLFGYGLGMQIAKANTQSVACLGRHVRRMATLAMIGLLHAALLFAGDILLTYAIVGIALMGLSRTRPRRLVVWACASYAMCFPVAAAVIAAMSEFDVSTLNLEAIRSVYASGTFGQVITQRVQDAGQAFAFIFVVQGPMAFAMACLGMAFARVGVLTRPDAHTSLLMRFVGWGLPVGLLGSVAAATLTIRDPDGLSGAIGFILQIVSGPPMCLAYVGLLTLWYRSGWLRRWVRAQETPGRMSLTIYLTESMLGALIFTSYGFGLFGRYGPAASVAIAAAIWMVCHAFAVAWMRRFRFGPMEWLLRSATYWRFQPLRNAAT